MWPWSPVVLRWAPEVKGILLSLSSVFQTSIHPLCLKKTLIAWRMLPPTWAIWSACREASSMCMTTRRCWSARSPTAYPTPTWRPTRWTWATSWLSSRMAPRKSPSPSMTSWVHLFLQERCSAGRDQGRPSALGFPSDKPPQKETVLWVSLFSQCFVGFGDNFSSQTGAFFELLLPVPSACTGVELLLAGGHLCTLKWWSPLTPGRTAAKQRVTSPGL